MANYSTTGRTHTARCAEGAGSRFYLNVTGNLTDPGNPLWWYNGATNRTGAALGNGASPPPPCLRAPHTCVRSECTGCFSRSVPIQSSGTPL
jgi:hypothetical protein